jgi:long-subunit acyl-CoA synthetase (AMP-forming)
VGHRRRRRGLPAAQAGQEPSGLLALKHKLADKLVFSKLKALFGGRIKYFVSGGAPLSARSPSSYTPPTS